jgi:CheY-like chemotaxis protein/MinD-like ATPase involved in chromosome partitioning or flagellar assembly
MADMAEKILIVDDDADTVKYLGLFITRLGYEPLQALDGMQALKLAHEQRPSLIILDVMMPGLDGYEVARSLRRHPETALIPILMFTAKSQTEDKLAGYEAGVDLYLTKPVHPVELQANIKTMLTQRKARAETLTNKGYMVGVLAAKGGLGVSTVALNLAVAYKQHHKAKVIAAEMRPGQGIWAEEMGFTSQSGLVNLLRMNHPEITRAVVEKQLLSNTFGVPLLLASNETCGADCLGALAQFEAVLEELSRLADLVMLDIGGNFHPAYEIFTQMCDEMILLTDPQPVTVKRTRYLLSDLKTRDFGSARPLTLVTVNRARTEMNLTASQVEDALGHSVALGFPPAPELAYLSANRATPMYLAQPGGIIAKQFDVLAETIAKHASG